MERNQHMRLPNKVSSSKAVFSVRMTPLIDVIFLLMIFFMVTIKFKEPEGSLTNRLPERGGNIIANHKQDWEIVRLKIKLVITSGDAPLIYLQERPISSYNELARFLDQLPKDILLVIEPEAKVPYKYIIGVYNTCKKVNRQNIVFAVAPT